jgi:hypothetical protein
VLVEVKAIDALAAIHSRQLYTYLRLAQCSVGLLLNFGAPMMKHGIKRVVNRFPDSGDRQRDGRCESIVLAEDAGRRSREEE